MIKTKNMKNLIEIKKDLKNMSIRAVAIKYGINPSVIQYNTNKDYKRKAIQRFKNYRKLNYIRKTYKSEDIKNEIIELRKTKTLSEIGLIYNLSRQRVFQIIKN